MPPRSLKSIAQKGVLDYNVFDLALFIGILHDYIDLKDARQEPAPQYLMDLLRQLENAFYGGLWGYVTTQLIDRLSENEDTRDAIAFADWLASIKTSIQNGVFSTLDILEYVLNLEMDNPTLTPEPRLAPQPQADGQRGVKVMLDEFDGGRQLWVALGMSREEYQAELKAARQLEADEALARQASSINDALADREANPLARNADFKLPDNIKHILTTTQMRHTEGAWVPFQVWMNHALAELLIADIAMDTQLISMLEDVIIVITQIEADDPCLKAVRGVQNALDSLLTIDSKFEANILSAHQVIFLIELLTTFNDAPNTQTGLDLDGFQAILLILSQLKEFVVNFEQSLKLVFLVAKGQAGLTDIIKNWVDHNKTPLERILNPLQANLDPIQKLIQKASAHFSQTPDHVNFLQRATEALNRYPLQLTSLDLAAGEYIKAAGKKATLVPGNSSGSDEETRRLGEGIKEVAQHVNDPVDAQRINIQEHLKKIIAHLETLQTEQETVKDSPTEKANKLLKKISRSGHEIKQDTKRNAVAKLKKAFIDAKVADPQPVKDPTYNIMVKFYSDLTPRQHAQLTEDGTVVRWTLEHILPMSTEDRNVLHMMQLADRALAGNPSREVASHLNTIRENAATLLSNHVSHPAFIHLFATANVTRKPALLWMLTPNAKAIISREQQGNALSVGDSAVGEISEATFKAVKTVLKKQLKNHPQPDPEQINQKLDKPPVMRTLARTFSSSSKLNPPTPQ